ncbi:MAG TPA: hypothetical protein VJ803_11805 [Gemmatimonadaceae bacterium]|jgi:hypothetical protein|nr:hypothetical protein [Gemmatimonadaceae bacterium]
MSRLLAGLALVVGATLMLACQPPTTAPSREDAAAFDGAPCDTTAGQTCHGTQPWY